jgi:hypothetical protein
VGRSHAPLNALGRSNNFRYKKNKLEKTYTKGHTKRTFAWWARSEKIEGGVRFEGLYSMCGGVILVDWGLRCVCVGKLSCAVNKHGICCVPYSLHFIT